MKTKSLKAPQVVLRRPHSAVGVLGLAKVIHDALAANPGMFPTPNPPLPQFSTDISALDAAETASHLLKGTSAARDAKLAIVISDLGQLRAYVQKVVDADPTNAADIAQNAGMGLRKVPVRNSSELTAKPGKVSGSIALAAKVGGIKSSHEWQYSTDGKTWSSAPTTLQARTTIPGFTPGTTVYLRHRAITKAGYDNWSQTVQMIAV
jgi:hypothetical protein